MDDLILAKTAGLPLRVLLVEESSADQLVAEEVFELLNCVVDTVDQADDVLKVLAEDSYDLVLLDAGASGLKGGEVVEGIRRLDQYLPCFVVSSPEATSGVSDKVSDAGFDGRLSKPLHIEQVQELLRNLSPGRSALKAFSGVSGDGKQKGESQILAVGDFPDHAEIINTFGQQNLKLSLAGNDADIRQLIEHEKPDVVLLDADFPAIPIETGKPALDPFSVCEYLHQTTGTRDIPVLMLLQGENAAQVQRAFEVMAADFYIKPVNWTILAQHLRHLLRTSRRLNLLENSQQVSSECFRLARLGYWEWDKASGTLYLSALLGEVFGYPADRISDSNHFVEHIVHPDDRVRIRSEIERFEKTDTPVNLECKIVDIDHRSRMIKVTSLSNRARPAFESLARGLIQDISELRRDEETVRRLAYNDSLTGLANREAFRERLNEALEVHQKAEKKLATIYIDLDDFKRINDTLGHDYGDSLLRQFSERLSGVTRQASDGRESDLISLSGRESVSPARLGGDEFSVLCTALTHAEDAAVIAARVVECVSEPFSLDVHGDKNSGSHDVQVTASVGVAVFPDDGETLSELLKNTDIAMYHAKRSGKNTYRFYTESMNIRALERLDLESELRLAVEHDELSLHYQPQMDIVSGQVIGLEALLRWHCDRLGAVSPSRFVPLAEDMGLMPVIGQWVLDQACAQLKLWSEKGLKNISLAVNLSRLQFQQPEILADQVWQALKSHRIPPEYLDLELSESMLMGDEKAIEETLNNLKQMGVQLSLDDFGSGYSNLPGIRRYPIDNLKINDNFVRGIGVEDDATAMVKAMIAIAQNLGLNVIAEGVETEAQAEFLKREGCVLAQGFLYSEALPAEAIPDYIARTNGS